jgi:hypothetical protein
MLVLFSNNLLDDINDEAWSIFSSLHSNFVLRRNDLKRNYPKISYEPSRKRTRLNQQGNAVYTCREKVIDVVDTSKRKDPYTVYKLYVGFSTSLYVGLRFFPKKFDRNHNCMMSLTYLSFTNIDSTI